MFPQGGGYSQGQYPNQYAQNQGYMQHQQPLGSYNQNPQTFNGQPGTVTVGTPAGMMMMQNTPGMTMSPNQQQLQQPGYNLSVGVMNPGMTIQGQMKPQQHQYQQPILQGNQPSAYANQGGFVGNSAPFQQSVPLPQGAPTRSVSNVTPGVSSRVSLPFIASHELVDSERIFFQSRPNSIGLLSAETARNVLIQSGLNQDVLGRIWAMSNISGGNALTFPEFALAMYLTKLHLSGSSPPFTLPDPVKAQVVAANMVLTAPAPAPEIRWAVTPQEKQQWDQIFKTWDPQNTGYISGDRARSVFLQSGLSPDLLGHIWAVCDTQNRGKLNADEFAVAMHLVYAKLAGQDLPRVLPPELVPPSTRELDNMANMMKEQALNSIQNKQAIAPSTQSGVNGGDTSLPAFLRAASSQSEHRNRINQENADKRRHLESELQDKRRQVRDAKDAVADAKRDTRRMEDEVRDLRRSIDSLQLDISSQTRIRDNLTSRSGGELDMQSISRIEVDIRNLAEECRNLEARLADRKTNEARTNGASISNLISTTGNDPVAQLLSQRMAALSGGTSTNFFRIDEEHRSRDREVQDLLGDASNVVDQLRALGGGAGVISNSHENGQSSRARPIASSPSRTQQTTLPSFLRQGASSFPSSPGATRSPAPPPPPSQPSIARAEEIFPTVDSLTARFPSAEDILSGSSTKPAAPPAPQIPVKTQKQSMTAKAPPPLRPSARIVPSTASAKAPPPPVMAGPKSTEVDDEIAAQMAKLMALDAKASELNAIGTSGIPSPLGSSTLSAPGIDSMAQPTTGIYSSVYSQQAHASSSPAAGRIEHFSTAGSFNQGVFNTPEAAASLGSMAVTGGAPAARASTQDVIAQAQAAIQAAKDRTAKAKEDAAVKAAPKSKAASAPVAPQGLNMFGSNDYLFGESSNPFGQGPSSHSSAGFDDHVINPFDTASNRTAQPRAPLSSSIAMSDGTISVKNTTAAVKDRSAIPNGRPGQIIDEKKAHVTGGYFPSAASPVKKPLEEDWKAVSNPAGVLYTIRAIYAYEISKADDLQLSEGDIIGVEREDGEWLYGSKNGLSGWFPKTYVETISGGASAPSSVPSTQRLTAPTAEVIYDYTKANDDELTVFQGDLVNVVEKSDSNWWKVQDRYTKIGLVPASYLHENVSGFERGPGRNDRTVATTNDTGSFAHRSGPVNNKSVVSDSENFISSSISNPFSLDDAEPLGGSGSENPFADGDDLTMPSSHKYVMNNSAKQSFNTGPTAALWAEQVDPVLLNSLDADERKRQEAIYELIATEKSYVRDLQLIIEVFYNPMSMILSPNNLNSIFSNIDELLLANTVILSEFESLQEASHYYIQTIGEVFVKYAPSLDCYRIYCGNQSMAAKVLQKLRNQDHRVAESLKACLKNPKCRALDLSTFLLEPMQRIVRYSILLDKVLHYTPQNHPDYQNVIKAMDLSEKLAGRVNEAAREKEAFFKVEEIARMVDLFDDNLKLASETNFMGPRALIMEGLLAKTKSGRKLHGFLFNDLMLLVEPKTRADSRGFQYTLYRRPMYLTDIVVREIPIMGSGKLDGADENCFQVVFKEDIITVRAFSVAEKRKWISSIETQCAIIRALFS